MPRSRWAVAPVVLATVLFVTVPNGEASTSASAPAAGGPSLDSYPDGTGPRNIDNRAGMATPSARQRGLATKPGLAVRWNAFGTPQSVTVTGPAKKVLAAGLAADPRTAARQYLIENRDLYGLDEAAVAGLDVLLDKEIGDGRVVLFRQRFGDLPAGHDGLVAVAVKDGQVLHVTSSLSRATGAPEPATLSADDAFRAAVADAGLAPEQVVGRDVQPVAVPTPFDGPRAAYQVSVISDDVNLPTAFTTYIDGRTGQVLVRDDLVNFDTDNPRWAVFPANPPNVTPAGDPRTQWCQTLATGCSRAVTDPASGRAWDIDLITGLPTLTSSGNSVNDVLSLGAGTPPVQATQSVGRNYTYAWTDQWRQARCNPTVFQSLQRNDADAAIANLFAIHNRMHDFAYRLGFTEEAWNMQVVNVAPGGLGGDAEQGRAQAGALSGSRNNANQGTPRDGLQPTTNMFLWQPIAGSAYPPCVDGDYDATVIGHEYTHAITNRMIAGPDTGIQSFQGGSMGESWSDLVAAEVLFEHGLRAVGETPFVTGGYVTGDARRGIRNYDFSRSPLNYSDVGFNTSGPEVHADGEIWSATNIRVRNALVGRYGAGTPKLQLDCAEGRVAVDNCPGNRRWIQLMFDSFLLQASGQVSMLDMRDNMLAADLIRFGGANQDIIWGAFAESGMGQDAVTVSPADTDPTPSFASPFANNSTVVLRPQGDSAAGPTPAPVRLYVGDYEARATPVADTDPETAIPDTFTILPGKLFSFTVVAPGFGAHRFTTLFLPGRTQELRLNLPRNLAASAAGATVSGDGINLDKLVDETEATNWASRDGVAGRQITVDLAGDRPQQISVVNLSAMVRPAIADDPDVGSQGPMTGLRSFEILACDATVADCATDAGYRSVFTSPTNAFPGGAFRPFSPELNLRSFRIPLTSATHLRLRVLTSQCTGNPLYAGEQDADPAANTDCATASPAASQVRIAEFQVFTR